MITIPMMFSKPMRNGAANAIATVTTAATSMLNAPAPSFSATCC